MKKVVDLGLLSQDEGDWAGNTYKSFMMELMNNPQEEDTRKALAQFLDLEENSEIIERLEWLGLLEDTPIPEGLTSPLDILGDRMQERLQFEEGERDMIILQHVFEASYPNDKKENQAYTR